MSGLQEHTFAELATRLDDLGKRKQKAEHELAEILDEVKTTALEAYQAGMRGTRITDLARISPASLVTWARDAGLARRRNPNGSPKDGRSHRKKRAP